jgi:hypothetical protein
MASLRTPPDAGAWLALHGLTIALEDDPAQPGDGSADVRWLRLRGRPIPDAPPGEAWAWRVFEGRGGAAMSVAVSPDGREVVSYATEVVSARDAFGLFAEAVMRTVMRRLGVVSFHAAALSRDGAAVLVMGGKGAGKSSFATALAQSGWSLLADDLARILREDGAWRVAPGHRQIKLNADVAAALGYDVARLERRWTPGQPQHETPNKHVLSHGDGGGTGAVPIAAIYSLGGRAPALRSAVVTPIPAAERLALLLGNLSDDPLEPAAGQPAQAGPTAVSILREVPVLRLELPDDLGRLREVAAAFRPPA